MKFCGQCGAKLAALCPQCGTMRKVLFLFGQLNDDDVEWMLRAGQKRFIPAGGVLIEQGVPVDSVFILLEGKLAVSLRSRRGPERESSPG
jgi:CRP-like cAMP-binding protein